MKNKILFSTLFIFCVLSSIGIIILYDYNSKLEEQLDIKNKMIESGIETGAIDVKSESDRKPLADNSTREGRNKNRRAEIIIQ